MHALPQLPPPDSGPDTPGRRIRAYRHLRDWTQAELAEKAGITAQSVWRLEDGAMPQADTLGKLAAALDVPAGYLLPEAEIPDAPATEPA